MAWPAYHRLRRYCAVQAPLLRSERIGFGQGRLFLPGRPAPAMAAVVIRAMARVMCFRCMIMILSLLTGLMCELS